MKIKASKIKQAEEEKIHLDLEPLFDRSNLKFMSWKELKNASEKTFKMMDSVIEVGNPVLFSMPPQRIIRPYMPSDFCHLSGSYDQNKINCLLDQAELRKNNFRVFIKVQISFDEFRMYSLEPTEIIELRKDIAPLTMIIYDSFEPPMGINVGDLWGSKIEATNLLLNTPSSHVEDLVAIATIDCILPEIITNEKAVLTNKLKWECFLMLESALKRCGAKSVKFFKEKNKDCSSISGTDVSGGEIDVNYKAYRVRLPNLVFSYLKHKKEN